MDKIIKPRAKNKNSHKYLNNPDILQEIEASKLSYCSWIDDRYKQYDALIHSWDEVIKEGIVYRLYSIDHIPDEINANRNKKRHQRLEAFIKVNFNPFIHVIKIDDEITTVLKSHWVGGMENGYFSMDGGRITNKLAMQIKLLCERLGSKGNFNGYTYVDDMICEAILQTISVALKFNEAKSTNAFAYLTAIAYNAFRGCLNKEKSLRNVNETLLNEVGLYTNAQMTGYKRDVMGSGD